MFGQGSPRHWREPPTCPTRKVVVGGWAFLLWMVLSSAPAFSAEGAPGALRLRFEWGGGARKAWTGEVSVDRGRLSQLEPLGIEADEPGAMWVEEDRIRIAHRSGRTYDAFDVLLVADADATLSIKLGDGEAAEGSVTLRVPVASIGREVFSSELDQQGNRLLIRRAPGDRMRVEFSRDTLVFAPDENFSFTLHPQLPEIAPGTPVRVVARLNAARSTNVIWSRDYDVRLPVENETPLALPFDVPLPAAEGAYDVQLLVFERSLRQRLVNVVLPQPLAERKVQVVVVSPDARSTPHLAQVPWQHVGEINPANPGWWKRLVQLPQLTLIPGWPQGPLRSGDAMPAQHPLGAVIRFAQQTSPSDTTWEAYPLPIDRVGAPHILEVDYPSDVAQHLGISIIEPNASGAVLPIGLDSGVYVLPDTNHAAPRTLKHRLVFWPTTKTPMVLLVQRSRRTPAAFTKLRVLAGPERLPTALPASRAGDQRLVTAFYDRPLFPENFSATGVFDEWSGQTIDDWETFFQGGTRLSDYLGYAGYNSLMLNVWGDGSAIYPSEHLQSTPRYDTGLLGTSGRDPQRKDVLEMLLRVFDRNQMKLIPALQFAAPLPELEAVLRKGGAEAEGIELIGPDGSRWLDQNLADRNLAPYYNPLHERVQEAMLEVARELVTRYGDHPSFAGVAVQLSAETYAQLPGAEWGLDDVTVARFAAETGIKVPAATGPQRYSVRAAFLLGSERSAWLTWRAKTLADFYDRMQRELATIHPQTKLYLAGTGLFEGAAAQQQLRPALPQSSKLEPVLLELGLQPALYTNNDDLIFMRPRRIGPPDPLYARAIDLQLNTSSELETQLAEASQPANLFYHPRQRLRLRSFEQQSPFGEAQTYALLVTHSVPAAMWNRQRFTRAIAQRDPVMLCDGGWLLPLGQEDAVRPLFSVFRQLPATGFQTSSASRQPVTVRTLSRKADTLVYLVNDSPWPVELTVHLEASTDCSVAELSETGFGAAKPLEQSNAGTQWTLTMQPFDLLAAKLSKADVTVKQLDIKLPEAVELTLNEQIADLGSRAAALANQSELTALTNPDMEQLGPPGTLVGWSLVSDQGVEATLDADRPYAGQHALRLTSTRQVASLQSDLFDTPATGRLAVKVWLRAESTHRQPVLRLAVEGVHDGKTYYRYAPVGGHGPGSVPMQTEWTSYIFQVDDLPTEGVEQIRVRFDLMGPGTVWIDEVQLYQLKFNMNERVELSKILESARRALNTGDLSDCLRILQGYWPQFLAQNVEPLEVPLARQAQLPARPRTPASESKDDTRPLDRLRGVLPKWPFQ